MSTEKIPYTTLTVDKTTHARFKKLKGRGTSSDKYINDLLDLALQENKENDNNKETGRSQDKR